ncbi:MAG: M14 family metallopeptidase [bacterium]
MRENEVAGKRLKLRFYAVVILVALVAAPLSLPSKQDKQGWVGAYPPLSEVFEDIRLFAENHPELADLEIIGKSVEGRPLYMLHIGRKDGRERPEALITANIHAGEVISSQVAMEACRRLLEDEGDDPWITSLLDQTDFYIVPVLNPDGYHRVISTGGKGGDIGIRKNANGVDLNRNFPLVPGADSWHPLAGSDNPDSNYYMGEKPLSEPETRAIAELAREHNFYAALNMHSVAGKFLYPYCFDDKVAPHSSQFESMGRAFVHKQPERDYKVEQSYGWYPTLGDMDDFLYIRYGVLSATIEHGIVSHNFTYALVNRPFVFWIMNPYDAQNWVENDADAVLAAIEKALSITGGKSYSPSECKPEPEENRWESLATKP